MVTFVAALSVLGAAGRAAMQTDAQEDDFRLMRRALVAAETAYVPLPAEQVCANYGGEVSVSPTATDALLITNPVPSLRTTDDLLNREAERLRRLEQGLPVETNLLSWSFDSRRPMTVWRGGGSLQTGFSALVDIAWLPDTRVALVTVMVTPPLTLAQREAMRSDGAGAENVDHTLTILCLNAGTGKVQTLLTGVKSAYVLPSRTDPVAALFSDDNNTVQRVSPDGALSPPITVVKPVGQEGFFFWLRWALGGRTLLGTFSEKVGEGQPRKRSYYSLDTITGVMTTEEAPPPRAIRAALAANALPFVVQQETDTLGQGGVKTDVNPLWLAGRNSADGRLLIAADSDSDFKPVALTTAVLYRKDGTIYAVPLLKSSAARFLARRREVQKQETLRRAKELGTAFLMYTQDYDGNLPPVGSSPGKALEYYADKGSLIENPATGRNGFTPAYKTSALASIKSPALTPLGSLDGPGGVAVIYLDGHVQWEERPGGKP